MKMETKRLIEKITALIDKATEDKSLLKAFKNLAVRGQQYELAAEFRDIEKKHFPESDEQRQAKEDASALNLVFRMVELNVPEETCWLIANTIKVHNKKKGSFSLKDAAGLLAKKNQYFED